MCISVCTDMKRSRRYSKEAGGSAAEHCIFKTG